MNALEICTLVLEFNYVGGPSSLGSVWIFNGEGRPSLENAGDLENMPGWNRVIGPIDYQLASEIHANLRTFLERAGVTVIDEGVAD